MGTLVTLDEAKAHLRVDTDDDDALITIYNEAAFDYCQNYLNVTDMSSGNGDSPTVYPAGIRAAALLLIGDFYENRQISYIDARIADNPAVVNLLHPYRKCIGI